MLWGKLRSIEKLFSSINKSIEYSNEQYIMPYVNIISTYLSLNDLFTAFEYLEEIWAVKPKPKNLKKILRYWGFNQMTEHKSIKKIIISFENKEFNEGVDLINEIYPKYPKNIILNWYLGLNYMKLANEDLAIKYFK